MDSTDSQTPPGAAHDAPGDSANERDDSFVHRYARWIEAHHRAILALALIIAAVSTVLATRLEVRADFSDLLPPSKPSVRDLNAIKSRVSAFATLFVVVEASDPQVREKMMRAVHQRVEALGPELVANLGYDDAPARRFVWDNRFLLADMDDLRQARDALEDKIRQAKLDANPLFIDLGDDDDDDDDDAGAGDLEERVADLKERLDQAETEAKKPADFVSRTGRYQLIVIRATFTASEVAKGRELLAAVQDIVREVEQEYGAADDVAGQVIDLGVTGDVATGVHEHRSILRGMILAAVVTILIVAIALLLYYRSVVSVMSLLWSLTVGSIATFGVTALTIGHLNLATAFLAAIVIGNGINPNLILLARYFEERRFGNETITALALAMRGAARGTIGASLTASVAYASLIVTEFRGFRHFGIIGGIGMVLCWCAAFTVLPAALVWLRRRIEPRHEPALGRVLARILPRQLGWVAAFGLALTVLCGYMTWSYLTSDPLEDDWRNLRSTSSLASDSRYWDELIKREFDQGFNRNLSGRFVAAVEDRAEVPAMVALLRGIDEGKDPDDALFLYVYSFNDLVPPDQDEKLALLGEIRSLVDDNDLVGELAEGSDDAAGDADLIKRVRPPDDLGEITASDVPRDLAWLFTESNGETGRIVHSASGPRFDTWNVRHLVAFSEKVRALDLPEGVVIGGQAFVFADILGSMETDGPRATWVALVGSALVIWLAIGYRRHGLVTLLCTASGTLGMIALVSLFGVKINFLDFIALPITVGIGIDYAINIAAREQQDGHLGPRHVLATTGGAVFLCSFTTTVGYGSLLLSENAGIRSFGLAAILGELACMVAALILAPALLALLRKGDVDRPLSTEPSLPSPSGDRG